MIKKLSHTTIEKPKPKIREMLKGHTIEDVSITLEKHATTCVISGQIQYQNKNSRRKHIKKWETVVQVWFWNSSIEAITAEPFVTWKVDEEMKKRLNITPLSILLERNAEIKKLKDGEQ
jgi:hypothetical protein